MVRCPTSLQPKSARALSESSIPERSAPARFRPHYTDCSAMLLVCRWPWSWSRRSSCSPCRLRSRCVRRSQCGRRDDCFTIHQSTGTDRRDLDCARMTTNKESTGRMSAEQAALLRQLAFDAYEPDAFTPDLSAAEADRRIGVLRAKLRLMSEPPHTQ